MSVFGQGHATGHPLDVDLADLVDGVLDDARTAQVEAHLTECLSCRLKVERLVGSPAAPAIVDRTLPSPGFLVPAVEPAGDEASTGDLWLAGPDPDSPDGSDERVMVVVLGAQDDGRLLVAPVTFDVEAADEETLVVDAAHSPLRTGLAVHPRLATEVPAAVLVGRLGSFGPGADLGAVRPGVAAVAGASDPRLDIRQYLADRLCSLEEQPPDPATGADAPAPGVDHVRSALIGDLRSLRGHSCTVRPLYDWGDVLAAHRAGWEPLVTVDEVGVVLVVFDTPHGLVDDSDFDDARSVLTRFNGTALVVLAGAISDLAEVFDSSSLNHGIDAPSGRHTPPRPLISGLTPFDAMAKFLDQTTGARTAAPASRGPITRVDVGDILREAAGDALAEAARQGARFKILPKRRGYESVAGAGEPFAAALGRAFDGGSVVDDVLHLVPNAGDGTDE
jgi:anti-sigma factor RsiW